METGLQDHVPEKELPLTTPLALEKDPSLTTGIPLEKDLFVTTPPASEKDPSLTINQASEKDPSLTINQEKDPSLTINQEKDPYLTITPTSKKDPSLTIHASENVPVFTTEPSEKDSVFTTQASEKESLLTSTHASENDSIFTNQTSKNDLSLTTNQASEKDSSSSTTQASEKDPALKTTQASDNDLSLKTNQAFEKDPSFTTIHASEKDPSLTTIHASDKNPSSTATHVSEKDPSFTAIHASEKDPSSRTTQAAEKDPSSRTTQASEKDPSQAKTQASEKDPSLIIQALEKDSSSTPQASEKDISSTTTQESEKDISSTTTQESEKIPSSTETQASEKLSSSTESQAASEKDPSSITQVLENDSSLIPQASEKDISSTTTQASEKIPSLKETQASEKLSSSTEFQVASEKDPSSTATHASEKDPYFTATHASDQDLTSTTQASKKDPSSRTSQESEKDPYPTTTQALDKDPSSTAQASENDISLTTTQVSEKVLSLTETQASEKISSSTESQASEKDPSLTAQASEKDPLTTERVFEKAKLSIQRMPSDMSNSSRPPSVPGHRRSKSDVSSGNSNKRAVGFQKWKSQVQRALKWGKDESKDYNFNPEILADQKRQWYQLHPDSLGLTYKEPTSLFEHFIIAGLHPHSNLEAVETAYARLKKWELHNENKEAPDPKTRQRLEPPSLEPEILFEYPPGKRLSMSPKDLAAFCFPDSVKARVLERTPSLSELNEIVFGQEHLSTDDLSFVFSLKVADNATLYGVCLLVKEIVQRPPTPHTILGDSMPQSPSYEGSSRVLTSAPRCYCLLTRAPFFELHYEMLKSIITQERLTRITQFVNYVSMHDHAPAVSRSNDQKKENDDDTKEECSTDWMATAIPIDSAVALTAAAAGIISDDEIFSSSSKGEHRSSESTSTETSEHSHVREIVNESGKNFQSLDDYTSEASETLRDGLDVEQKLEVAACANPRIHTMDPPANSESLISSVSSMDEDGKLSCSNEKISKEDWIVEWAKENNNALLQIVCSYYSLPFPETGEKISFKPLEHLQTVEYQRPSVSSLTQTERHLNNIRWDTLSALEGNKKLAAAEEAAALSIWTTAAMCRALSLENILTLLTGVLLEKQVLFVYPNLGVLSAMVLSIIPIIRPFQWQSLFLPVLPGKMKDFLDAPVPFIVGMQHMPTDFKLKTSNLIHVDIAKDQVKSCKLPALPDYKDLISELGPIYFKMSKQHSIAKKRPVYQYNETEAEAAGRFLAVMRRYLYSLCTDMRSHTITSVRANNDRVSILLKDSFLDSFPSKDQPFIKLFLDTQLFSVLSDSYLSNYEN